MAIGRSFWGGLLAMLLGVLLGQRLASRARQYRCADPACETQLTPEATACPGCRRAIAGDLENPNERLEALERMTDEASSGETSDGAPGAAPDGAS